MNIRADETSQGTNEGTTKESTFVAKRSGKVKALKPLNGTAVSALVALQELTNTKSPRQMNGLELNLFSIYLQKYQEATGSTLEDLLRDPHLPVAIREQIKETLDKKDKDIAQATAVHLAQEDNAQKENLRQRYEEILRELAAAERDLEEARVRLIAAEQALKLAEERLDVAQKDLNTAIFDDKKATQEYRVAEQRHEKSTQDFVVSIVTDIRNASPEEKRRLLVVAYKMGLRDNVAQMLSDADKSMLANIDFTIYKKKGVSLEDLDGLASDTTKKHFEQFSNTRKELEHCKQNKAKTQASVRDKQEEYESAKKDKSSKKADVEEAQKEHNNFLDTFNELFNEMQKTGEKLGIEWSKNPLSKVKEKVQEDAKERWKNPPSVVRGQENPREKIINSIGNTEKGRGNRGSGGVSPSLTPTQGTNKGVESKSSTEQQTSVRNKEENYESAKKDKSSKEANVKDAKGVVHKLTDMAKKAQEEVQKSAKEAGIEWWKNPSSVVKSKGMGGNPSSEVESKGVGGNPSSEAKSEGVGENPSSVAKSKGMGENSSSEVKSEGMGKNPSSEAKSEGVGENSSSEVESEGMGGNSSSEAKSEGMGENPSSEAKSQETGGVLDVLKNHSQGDSQGDSTRVNNSVSNTR